MRPLLWFLVVTLVALALALWSGAYRWRNETHKLRSRLEAARLTGSQRSVGVAGLETLPQPVRRYIATVLRIGQPEIARVGLSQRGTFNLSETGSRWMPFSSDQVVVTRRPGFDWNARLKLFPGINVNVHDAYIAGEGNFHAAVCGLFSVGRFRGTGLLAEGELMRYLAEAAWYPTALLPGAGVQWQSIDTHSATATIMDESARVSLTFTFDDDGLISTVEASSRGRTVGTKVVPTPWRGRFWNYEVRGGIKIPLDGEAEWILPSGTHPYWRGTVSTIDYSFS